VPAQLVVHANLRRGYAQLSKQLDQAFG